jgi:hypothetical protein
MLSGSSTSWVSQAASRGQRCLGLDAPGRSRAGGAGRGWQFASFDELALGLGIRLAVRSVALSERTLERRVLSGEHWVGAQSVAEAQAPFELVGFVYEVQVVGAVGGRRVAQEPAVGERRVERRRVLVAAVLHQPLDRRVEVVHAVTRTTSSTSTAFGEAARLGKELELGLLALLFETDTLRRLVREFGGA